MPSMPPRGTVEDPDRELILRWKRAHREREEATQELRKRYAEKVDGFYRSRGYRPQELEDLTQMTFSHVFNGLGDYRGARFAAWLFKIAENIYKDDIRRRRTAKREGQKKERSLDEIISAGEEPAIPADSPNASEEALEQITDLRREIENLPPRMRHCVQLHIYHELKVEEVGLAMNISKETVKAHLYQARELLKKRLGIADPGF